MSETATEAKMRIERQESDQIRFQRQIDRFIKRWEPLEGRQRHDFTVDLMALWHALYIDMSRAYAEVTARQMALSSLSMQFVQPEKPKS